MNAADVEKINRQIFARTQTTSAGCRIFTGYKNANGYGVVKMSGRVLLAHRAVWAALHGEIPSRIEVCHRCDTPACVEPEHLFLGTRHENQADMYRKGRGRKAAGERHGRAKLTSDAVRQMREMHSAGLSYRYLANKFGVGKTTAADAVRGHHWKGLDV